MPMTKENASEKFEFFYKNVSPFSQFYYTEFEIAQQKYSCAEQYMMHQKAVLFKDDEIAQMILEATEPLHMKRCGRKVKNYDDEVWNKHCFEFVKNGNRHKFSQNEDIKAKLFATKGKILVEASPSDRKWGIGLNENDRLAWDENTWKGQNLLGYALTEVREELMGQEGLS